MKWLLALGIIVGGGLLVANGLPLLGAIVIVVGFLTGVFA